MIETDIRTIKKHHVKTNKSLKVISDWQTHHEKEDNAHFKEINEALAKLPTETAITDAVAVTVKETVNGKILFVQASIDKLAEHLVMQDENMEEFRKQVKPLNGIRTYTIMTGKVIAYLLSTALGITAVIEIVKMIINK